MQNAGTSASAPTRALGNIFYHSSPRHFRSNTRDVKLKVSIGYSEAMLSALKRHELDVALVASQPRDEDLRGRLFLRDRLVAVMSPRCPLANRDVLHIKELAQEPLIVLTELSELRERVVRTFHRFQVPLNVQVETGTVESVKKMVAEGMGIGIVPRMCVQEEERNCKLVVKQIEEFEEQRGLWMVCRDTRALPPTCLAFMKVAKSELAALKAGRAA